MRTEILRVTHEPTAGQPLLLARVPAGWPSSADDYIEDSLDLHQHLVRHPAATFFVRSRGESMREAGILDGALLVVDRAVEPRHGDVVVAAVHGELTVKRLHLNGSPGLVPANPEFAAIPIDPEHGVDIWGVVTYVIQRPAR